jgi:hypothetical protein
VAVSHTTGNPGIHTTTPQAKVDVAGSVRIIDGLQAKGRVLTSDPEGNAYWGGVMGSTGKIETVLEELGPQDIAPLDSVAVLNSGYPVEEDGYYVYEIRWHATYASTPPRQVLTATHIQLILHSAATGTDSIADEFEMYHDITAAAGDAVTFWMSLAAQARAGDELHLTVRPSMAHATLQLRKDNRYTTSRAIVKRLNVR